MILVLPTLKRSKLKIANNQKKSKTLEINETFYAYIIILVIYVHYRSLAKIQYWNRQYYIITDKHLIYTIIGSPNFFVTHTNPHCFFLYIKIIV